MPKELTDENQRWDAFRMVLSRVRDQLRDMLTIGDCGTVCGEEVNIVPHVTAIFREYANSILKVRSMPMAHALCSLFYACRAVLGMDADEKAPTSGCCRAR